MSKNKEFIQSEIKSDEQIGITKDEISRIQALGKVRNIIILKYKKLQICVLEINIEDSKEIYRSGFGGNYIGILPSNTESLRERIKEKLKLNTESQNNKLLEAEDEIREIENSSFFTYRLINDNFKNSYQIFKNRIISIYPIIKTEYSKIEKIKEYALKNDEQEEI